MTIPDTAQEIRASLVNAVRSDAGQRKRQLFHELNPEMSHTPILKKAEANPRPASVMIPIVLRENGANVLFTVRTSSMPSHAGEICFPGGGPKGNDRSAIDTALRETHEEIGIAPDEIDVVGQFGAHFGGLGYVVTPVLGIVHDRHVIRPCPREVDEVFEVPLASLILRERHIIETRILGDVSYQMFAFPFDEGEPARHIWGLTAGIADTLSQAWQDGQRAP